MNLSKGCSAKEALKLKKNHFYRNKASGKNYANNPTDKRIVLLEGKSKSNNGWKVFTWGKNYIIIKKREVLKSKENPENKSLSLLAKI